MNTIKKFTQKINDAGTSAYAAQSSFFVVVCFFPFVFMLLTIIQYTPIDRQLILDLFLAITPQKLAPLITDFIADVYTRPSIALFSTSAIITLWVLGKTFLGITQGLNSIYNEQDNRNYIIRRILASLYTLIFIIVLVLCMILLVFGSVLVNRLENVLPLFAHLIGALLNQKFFVLQCFLTLFFMLLYKFVPNRKTPLIRELPGAVFAAAGWQFFSYIYSVYVENSAKFDIMYGRLSVIVFAMLWLYFCINIFFYGAILNAMFFNKSE